MTHILRGMILDIDFEPTRGSETSKVRPAIVVTNDTYNRTVGIIQVVPLTGWTEKKARVRTNVLVEPTNSNGLTKTSIADCLQTRPVDHRQRLRGVRGVVDQQTLDQIGQNLKIVFALT